MSDETEEVPPLVSQAKAVAENAHIVGQAGPYSLVAGVPPVLGSGARHEYTPPVYLEPPAELNVIQWETEDGVQHLYGTPLTHAAQQLYAVEHARGLMGFDPDTPITLYVKWAHIKPTLFTVGPDGWVQGVVVGR